MRDDKKIKGLIGLAQRAGKISSGATQVQNDVKRGKALLLLVASDASANTLKEYRSKSEFYRVPLFIWGDKDSIGHAIGKPMRSAIAVLDHGFADRIKELLVGEEI
ncbi:MAG: ribosomal L7Ae/L30e/S12e/Gadd45 family protein [Halanaerobiales bacterium]|nr:ribosomal L7Ae/L30e/S12e/Gadd45 family protein [Halanaerobiales bacterium]